MRDKGLIRQFIRTVIQERLDRLKGEELRNVIKDELTTEFERLDAFQPSDVGTEQDARRLFVKSAVYDDGSTTSDYESSKVKLMIKLAYFRRDLWGKLIEITKSVVTKLSDRIGWRVVTYIPRGLSQGSRWAHPELEVLLEPIHDEETEATASKLARVFYHITDQENVPSIMNMGLTPRRSEGATRKGDLDPLKQQWVYTPRTYIMTRKLDVMHMLQSGIFLSNDRVPIVLEIKTSAIPKDVKFYVDKERGEDEKYFWTEGVIPPGTISIPEQKKFWLPEDWRDVEGKLKYGASQEKWGSFN